MRCGDLGNDGKTEPCSTRVAGARIIEPDEPLENPPAILRDDPVAIVVDRKDNFALLLV